MRRVLFRYTNGRERMLRPREADLLQRLRRGVIATEGRSQPAQPVEPNLDAMDRDELRALADARGIKVHWNAGADKLRAALRDAE